MPDFRLGVLTALWGRPRIAETVLRHYVSLRVPPLPSGRRISLVVCAVRSPEDRDAAADVPGVTYADAPNAPLSDKWNAGAATARTLAVDAVMIVGSDDLVSADYIAEAVRRICPPSEGGADGHPSTGDDFVSARDVVFVDTATGKAVRCRPSRLGAGRVLSRRLLDACGWQPWPTGLPRRLDGGMDRRLRSVGHTLAAESVVTGCGEVADLKSETNLWSFAEMAYVAPKAPGRSGLDGVAYLAEHFPSALSLLPMSKARTAAEKKVAARKTEPAADGPVTLVARTNIPGRLAGRSPLSRVEDGSRFEAPAHLAARLVRMAYAEAAP